ncbi:MAG TPA: restriction endonuclease [Roseiarcus sp.]|nr:restriction endonuclease [Roseiarcus sp.]
MSLPSFQQLMLPTLGVVCQRYEEIHVSRIEEELAKALRVPAEELSRLVPSGQQTIFANRLNWARCYLVKAGLVEPTRRGYVRATERARALLAEGVNELDVNMLARYPEFMAWRDRYPVAGPAAECDFPERPEERISASYGELQTQLARDLVSRVHELSPAFFERLIVALLCRMGYGGGKLEMGKTLGRSGDGGIDGVIKEDELGLDVVYVQAKRFAQERCVPIREVRDFVGGLEGHHATKGVFVTTSYFPSTAYDFVTRVSKRVVLIDGSELASLMMRHCVGVRVTEVYELKRLDEHFFVE